MYNTLLNLFKRKPKVRPIYVVDPSKETTEQILYRHMVNYWNKVGRFNERLYFDVLHAKQEKAN